MILSKQNIKLVLIMHFAIGIALFIIKAFFKVAIEVLNSRTC